MWLGDILQDILVDLLNGNWLSIITFRNYNCFSLFMALWRGCYFSSPAAGELPARRSLSSPPADAAGGPADRRDRLPRGRELLPVWRGNPLERFPCCPSALAAHPVPPSTSPPLPRTPRAGHHSPGCIVPEGSAVSGNRRGQEQSWNCCVILSFVTRANAWCFMFSFLIRSQGLRGTLSSFPLWDLCKTLPFFFSSHCKQHQTIKREVFLPRCNPGLNAQCDLRVRKQLSFPVQQESFCSQDS